jgi:hypothetical protein
VTYVNLRPDDVRPVHVLVNGEWRDGSLEGFRRDDSGGWRGQVRWFQGFTVSRVGWFSEHELAAVGDSHPPRLV